MQFAVVKGGAERQDTTSQCGKITWPITILERIYMQIYNTQP